MHVYQNDVVMSDHEEPNRVAAPCFRGAFRSRLNFNRLNVGVRDGFKGQRLIIEHYEVFISLIENRVHLSLLSVRFHCREVVCHVAH